MSRARQPSFRSHFNYSTVSSGTPHSHTDSYKDRYSNGTLGSTTPSRYTTTTSRFQAPSRVPTYSSAYGTGTASRLGGGTSTLTRVTSPRPLPTGPGPLDEHGRKIDINDTLLRSKQSDSLGRVRNGPVKASYATSPQTLSPVHNDTSAKHSLAQNKRTSSITNLTADLDNLHVNSTSFGRSKRFGSSADIATTSRTPDRPTERDDLYDTGSRLTVTKNYYNTGSHLYDYKDTEHSESSILPDIHKTGRTSRSPSQDRLKDEDTRPTRRTSLNSGSRQNSFVSVLTNQGQRSY